MRHSRAPTASSFPFSFCGQAIKFPAMKKYLHVVGIGIQNNLTYRVNYLTRTLFSFIPLSAMLSLWQKIYSGGATHSDWTKAEMIFYYLLLAVVDVFTAVNE